MDEKEVEAKAKELRAAYQRKWRSSNKEKIRRHNKRYWQKKAEEALSEKRQQDS